MYDRAPKKLKRSTRKLESWSRILRSKKLWQARAFVSGKVAATLDECFRLLGEQPAKLTGRLQEMLLEDFRRELAEIQGPLARRIFALVKLQSSCTV